MRKTWWSAALVVMVGFGCSKPDGDGGAVAEEAVAEEAAAPSDPALLAIHEFIAERSKTPDDRGRMIDKSKPNWRVMLPKPPQVEFTEGTDYVLHIKTNYGPVTIKLRPDLAPMHVSNAIYLTQVGFYDGNKSHRAIQKFMVQAGSIDGMGGGNLGYALDLEADGRHVYDRPGLLAAARTPDPNSAGSQFFLMLAPYPSLNRGYTLYGELVEATKEESLATLAAIEEVADPSRAGRPRAPIEFESFSITAE